MPLHDTDIIHLEYRMCFSKEYHDFKWISNYLI